MPERITFDEVLSRLGHVYVEAPAPDLPCATDRIRHIVKVHQPTGEVRPICGVPQGPDVGHIGCPALFRDADCPECLRLEGIETESLTKRSLLIDSINNMMNIEQMFLDAMYWNCHNPDEELINPDPEGELAAAWESSAAQVARMIDCFRPTMQKHAGVFGWPDEIVASEDD